MIPDIKTVMLLYAITNVICAVFMAITWHINHNRFKGILFWLITMALQAIGSILIVLRGNVPDFISLIASNTMIIAGTLIIFIGLEHFVGKNSTQIYNFILVGIYIASQVYFTYFKPNLATRTFAFSAITLILTFQCAWLMLRRADLDMRKSTNIVGIVFCGYFLISATRMIFLAIFPQNNNDFFNSGVPDTIILMFYIVLVISLTISLILMVNSRLIGDISTYAQQKDNLAIKLKENVLEFQNYLNVAEVMIMVIDDKEKVTLINRKGCEILEDSEANIVGKNWFEEFIPERKRKGLKTLFNKLLDEQLKGQEYKESLVITHNGKEKLIAWHNAVIRADDGRIIGILGSGQDITENKKVEIALNESEARYKMLSEQSRIFTWEVDEKGLYTFTDHVVEIILGFSPEELIYKKHFYDLTPEADRELLKTGAFGVFERKEEFINLENRAVTKDGQIVWLSTNGIPILNDDGTLRGYRGSDTDITERKSREDEILHLSYHDKLTDLYNRRFVEEEIIRLNTKRQLPLSIVMGDLNGLKIINDTFGHSEGDVLIKETAALLKKICRSDDILARWGGDEFVILLPKTSITDAGEIIARIKKECAKLIIHKIPLGLSIGVATKTEENQNIDKIIMAAEGNMYKNKLAQKESSASSIISALEQTLHEKSSETMEHGFRIKNNALKLGKSIKLHPHQLDELTLLASLHDIGKVAIPEAILSKEGKLTEEEWTVIKRHPEIGFNIAQSSPQIVHIAKFILACHENWDGSGYPIGLKEESIPIVSRIIFIADSYDVMTSKRIYKEAMSKNEAIIELKRCAGTQFDPSLIEKFIEILSN